MKKANYSISREAQPIFIAMVKNRSILSVLVVPILIVLTVIFKEYRSILVWYAIHSTCSAGISIIGRILVNRDRITLTFWFFLIFDLLSILFLEYITVLYFGWLISPLLMMVFLSIISANLFLRSFNSRILIFGFVLIVAITDAALYIYGVISTSFIVMSVIKCVVLLFLQMFLKTSIGTILDLYLSKYQEVNTLNDKLTRAMQFSQAGEIMSMVCHDIKNRIYVNYTALVHIRDKFSPANLSDDFERGLSMAISSAEHIRSSLGGILNYVRLDPKQSDKIHLKDCLMQAVEFAGQYQDVRRIELTLNISDEIEKGLAIPIISTNQYRLFSVFYNLIENAIEAILEDYAVTGNTKDKGEISLSLDQVDDAWHVHIRDNGPGFSSEASKLLYSVYTSKEKGTGLGIYLISKYLSSELGGSLTLLPVDSGTDILLTIPVNSDL